MCWMELPKIKLIFYGASFQRIPVPFTVCHEICSKKIMQLSVYKPGFCCQSFSNLTVQRSHWKRISSKSVQSWWSYAHTPSLFSRDTNSMLVYPLARREGNRLVSGSVFCCPAESHWRQFGRILLLCLVSRKMNRLGSSGNFSDSLQSWTLRYRCGSCHCHLASHSWECQ